jgi:ketosteroid isomerase-like protein
VRVVRPSAFRWRTRSTRSNAELVRRGYESFAAGDVQAALELIDPNVVVAVFTGRPGANRETYHGHEGFFENLGEMTDVFDDFRFEPLEIEEYGDRLLVTVRVTGRGKASGVGIDSRLFHVWTVRDGKAVRFEIYNERDEAEASLNA